MTRVVSVSEDMLKVQAAELIRECEKDAEDDKRRRNVYCIVASNVVVLGKEMEVVQDNQQVCCPGRVKDLPDCCTRPESGNVKVDSSCLEDDGYHY